MLDLIPLLPSLQTADLTDLPDDAIVPYVRIYSALYNLVSMNELDAEYGDRHIYLNQLRKLEGILKERYSQSTSITQWATYLKTAYDIVYAGNTTDLRQKSEEYWNTSSSLMELYFNGELYKTADIDELYAVLSLIFTQWYGYVQEEGEELPEPVAFARRQLGQWALSFSDESAWHWISDEDALKRIGLFQMNATMLMDGSFNETLDKAFLHYILKGDSTKNREIEILKYNVIQQSNLSNPQYGELLDEIAKSLESQYEKITDSMSKLQVCSVLVEHQTNKISESLQLLSN